MKHTIIECDLCGGRIYKDEWYVLDGAVMIRAKELKFFSKTLLEAGSPMIYPCWKRTKYHICPKCVKKIRTMCNGGVEDAQHD